MFYVVKQQDNERGSALVYILIAIALLAALTFTFMQPSSQQTSSQGVFKTVAKLESQTDIIRSTIHACRWAYKRGDTSIDNSRFECRASRSHGVSCGGDRLPLIIANVDPLRFRGANSAASTSIGLCSLLHPAISGFVCRDILRLRTQYIRANL